MKHEAPIVVVRADGVHADIVTVLSPGEAAVSIDDLSIDGSLQCQILRDGTTDFIQWSSTDDVVWNRWGT